MVYSVDGAERLTVPAGTFDTVKISGDGRWVNLTGKTFSDKIEIAIWYAPEVKGFVRFFRQTWYQGRVDKKSSTELVQFKINGEAISVAK